jgi:beta-N-acetylhexosaminidase
MGINDLSDAVIRFYSGLGQVLPGNLISYSFEDLQELLDAGVGVLQIENDLINANWIVISMVNVNPDLPTSLAFRNFLEQRPDLYQGKKLVVFAFDAPYFLDATDISKLTAYFGLFSKGDIFIDTAARLLFKELIPSGDLPVSVPAVSYDLNLVTFPDPDQLIELFLETPDSQAASVTGTSTPESTPMPPEFNIGDVISVYTGLIQDQNNHPVPDGTVVRFIVSSNGENGVSNQIETQTTQGIARTSIRIDRSGLFEIRAESEPATNSTVLQFDIPPENGTPSPSPISPTQTETPSPTYTATITSSPTPVVTPTDEINPPLDMSMSDWLFSIITVGVVGVTNYWIGISQNQLRWGIRAGLISIICGVFVYSYLVLEMPGSESVLQNYGSLGIVILTLLGAGLGTVVAWIWRYQQNMTN